MTPSTPSKQVEIFLWSRFVQAAGKIQQLGLKSDGSFINFQQAALHPALVQDLTYAFFGLLLGLPAGFLIAWIIFGA